MAGFPCTRSSGRGLVWLLHKMQNNLCGFHYNVRENWIPSAAVLHGLVFYWVCIAPLPPPPGLLTPQVFSTLNQALLFVLSPFPLRGLPSYIIVLRSFPPPLSIYLSLLSYLILHSPYPPLPYVLLSMNRAPTLFYSCLIFLLSILNSSLYS